MVIYLKLVANDLDMVQLMPLPPRRLLMLHYNPDWFKLSSAGLPKLSGKKRPLNDCLMLLLLCFTGLFLVWRSPKISFWGYRHNTVIIGSRLLHAKCPSCSPTYSIKATMPPSNSSTGPNPFLIYLSCDAPSVY